MADLEWKGVALVERRGRPADSPIWDGTDGDVQALLGANLSIQPPIYTAIVRVAGCPGSVAEAATYQAAIAQAFGGYDAVLNQGPRVRDLTPADRAKVAAIRGRPDSAPVDPGVRQR